MILQSIFTRSEEGKHDLIYTIYLISAVKVNDYQSQTLSVMITSLDHSEVSNGFLCLIPKCVTELLIISAEMDMYTIVQELFSESIIDKPKKESIISRKKPHYDRTTILYDVIIEMNDQKFLYPQYENDNNLISLLRFLMKEMMMK